jgi:hypothetical protein
VLNALKDEGLISSAAPAPPSPPWPGDSTPDWLAEASARASRRRDVEAEVATELRCRAAEMASELEHAQGAVSSTISLAEHAHGAVSITISLAGHAQGAVSSTISLAEHAQGAVSSTISLAEHAQGAVSSTISLAEHAQGAVSSTISLAEHAQGAVSSTISLAEHAQAASRYATTQRPATAPKTARETGYYITVTGGGACYHLTPMCSGLRQAGVMRVASTGGRRLCNICAGVNAKPLICAGVNAKPLIGAPSTALMSARHVCYTSTTGHQRSSAFISGHLPRPLVARHVYYTTRTGKKYHTDRCCSGLRNAATIFEVTSRPELDACLLCCRR